MSGPKLSKKDRKKIRELRRKRQNKRNPKGTIKTDDRKKEEYYDDQSNR